MFQQIFRVVFVRYRPDLLYLCLLAGCKVEIRILKLYQPLKLKILR